MKITKKKNVKVVNYDILELKEKAKDIKGNFNPSKLSKEEKEWINSKTVNVINAKMSFSEKIYFIENNLKDIPGCIICNNKVNFNSRKYEYRKTCSNKCANEYIKISGIGKERTKNKKIKNNPFKNLSSIEDVINIMFNKNNININYLKDIEILLPKKLKNEIKNKTKFFNTNKFYQRLVILKEGLTKEDLLCKKCKKQLKYKNRHKIFCSSKCSNSSNEKLLKQKTTCIKKYGVPTNLLSLTEEQITIRNKNILQTKRKNWPNDLKDERKLEELCKKFSLKELETKYKIPYTSIQGLTLRKGLITKRQYKRSHYENEIIHYLKSLNKNLNLILNSKKIITPYELDIFLPEYNFAIEFDGDYWHSASNEIEEKILKKRTKNKEELLKKKGINLLVINEFLWNNPKKKEIYKSIINTYLGLNKKIYARNCKIKKITDKNAVNAFLDDNHLQGKCGFTLSYGLFYNDNLISLLTLSKPRFSKKQEWEIIRICTKKYISVVGGVSKLFKYFVKDKNPSSILSFSDNRWSKTESIYNILNFKEINYTSYNYFWYNPKTKEILSRSTTQKQKLKTLLNNYNENLSESQNMFKNGYRKLITHGQKKYIWSKT